nr:MAG TPA: hypothetical protein [Crassvirales sp.]
MPSGYLVISPYFFTIHFNDPSDSHTKSPICL